MSNAVKMPEYGLAIIQQDFDNTENRIGGALWGNDRILCVIAGENVEARAGDYIEKRRALQDTYKGWDGATYPEYRTKLVPVLCEEDDDE